MQQACHKMEIGGVADRRLRLVRQRRTGGKGRAGCSELNLLGDAEGVVDLDAELTDSAFELRVSEEELYGSQVARLLINLSRLCSAHRVRAVRRMIETGALNPSMDDARVLASRQVRLLLETAGE
jgi:hypothetical protein